MMKTGARRACRGLNILSVELENAGNPWQSSARQGPAAGTSYTYRVLRYSINKQSTLLTLPETSIFNIM